MKNNHHEATKANKTDAGNGSKAICRVSNVLRSPSPDPRRSPEKQSTMTPEISKATIPTDLFIAKQAGEVVFVSIEPIPVDQFDEHSWRDLRHPLIVETERRDIAVLPTETVMWEGDDGDTIRLYPHLHFTCPRCHQMQNIDLYDTDPNPTFACCNTCLWDSPIWLAWDPEIPGYSRQTGGEQVADGKTPEAPQSPH